MAQRGDLCGQADFGGVQGRACGFGQILNLRQRQGCEKAQELGHIRILNIPPVLPEIVGGCFVGRQPHRAVRRFAHFGAAGGGQQGDGQGVGRFPLEPPDQIHTGNHVAPLVRSAHLQDAMFGFEQMPEIIGLQQHIVEF